MRHYEIIFMVNPDNSDQVTSMIERYSSIINCAKGQIHRLEDWGRRQLSYPIKKMHKAHYVLMNIEASKSLINEIETEFRFNDTVIRSMIIRVKHIVIEPSPIIKLTDEKRERREYLITESNEDTDIIDP